MDVKALMAQVKDGAWWKQLFVEKGEKIGLVGAAAFSVLAVLPLLWYIPFGKGPSANAKDMQDKTDVVEKKLADTTSKPGEDDNPVVTTVVVKDMKVSHPEKYQLAMLSAGSAGGDPSKRRQPIVHPPEDAIYTVARPQVAEYVFNDKYTSISVAKDSGKGGSGRGNPYSGKGNGGSGFPGGAGGPPGFPGGGPGRGRGSGSRPGQGNGQGGPPGFPGGGSGIGDMGGSGGGSSGPGMPGGGDSFSGAGGKKNLSFVMIPLAKLADHTKEERIQPLRQVIIDFDFPLRAQTEEFQRKLNLLTYADLMADRSGELDKEKKEKLPAFRFLGVELWRETIDPLSGDVVLPWEEIKVGDIYKPFIFRNGKRFEPEREDLEEISIPGLVMPRLLAQRPDQYPKADAELDKIKKTLASIKEKNKPPVLPGSNNPFDTDGFDPFNPNRGDADQNSSLRGGGGPGGVGDFGGPGGPGMKGGGGRGGSSGPGAGGSSGPGAGGPSGGSSGPGAGGGKRGQGDGDFRGPAGGGAGGGSGALADEEPPEYGLGRVIDLTVQPGLTYRYKMRIKMGNPNKDRKDVNSPKFTQDPYLLSDWFELKQDVVVPPETYFYAVDQKELEQREYKGQNAELLVPRDRQVVFQMHKWLYGMKNPNDTNRFLEVGEWLVAERFAVSRGEYLGRNQRIQVPLWQAAHEAFGLMADKNSPRYPGVFVDFSQSDDTDLVLVDFDGGEVKYDRGAGKPAVIDRTTTEVMVLAPDGRLLVHDSITDVKDPERIARLKAYRERIKDIKSGGKSDKPAGGSPFGKGDGDMRPQ